MKIRPRAESVLSATWRKSKNTSSLMKAVENKARLREWHFLIIMGAAVFIVAVILFWQERSMLPNLSVCPLCGQEVAQ